MFRHVKYCFQNFQVASKSFLPILSYASLTSTDLSIAFNERFAKFCLSRSSISHRFKKKKKSRNNDLSSRASITNYFRRWLFARPLIGNALVTSMRAPIMRFGLIELIVIQVDTLSLSSFRSAALVTPFFSQLLGRK